MRNRFRQCLLRTWIAWYPIQSTQYTRFRFPIANPMSTSSAQVNQSRFLADTNVPYCSLDVARSFALLTSKEKLYTHYISQVRNICARTATRSVIVFGYRRAGQGHVSSKANGQPMHQNYSTFCSSSILQARVNSPISGN